MKEIILAYQGEMSLKGLNRATFESVLLKTMRRRLKSLGNFKIYKAQSTMYAEPAGDEDIDAAEERIGKIFGIAAISRAAVCPKDFAVIADTAKEYLCGALRAAKTFKVSAKRSDKTFPMDSMEIARELGINFKQGYNGDLSSRDNGYVGGYMVKRLIQQAENQLAGKAQ